MAIQPTQPAPLDPPHIFTPARMIGGGAAAGAVVGGAIGFAVGNVPGAVIGAVVLGAAGGAAGVMGAVFFSFFGAAPPTGTAPAA